MSTLTIYHGSSKPIKAVGVNQCRLLAFAEKYRGWHTFAQDRATKRAVKALESKRCLIVKGDQFQFVYPSI